MAYEETILDLGMLVDSPCYGGAGFIRQAGFNGDGTLLAEEKVAYVEFWTLKDTLLECPEVIECLTISG